jgi:hypothetical protein
MRAPWEPFAHGKLRMEVKAPAGTCGKIVPDITGPYKMEAQNVRLEESSSMGWKRGRNAIAESSSSRPLTGLIHDDVLPV